jgi:hypothetical protein
MNLCRSGRFARVASLLPIVIVLCVGAFLSVFPTELDVPAALTKAHSSHVSQGTNLQSHPLEGSYLAVALGEAEDVDKHPVDADLLSALLLLAISFGVTFVWLLTNGRSVGHVAPWVSIRVGGSSAPSRIDPSWGCFGCRGFAAAPVRITGAIPQPANTQREGGSECPANTSPPARC